MPECMAGLPNQHRCHDLHNSNSPQLCSADSACVLKLVHVGQLLHVCLLTLTLQAYLLQKSNDCNRVRSTEHSTEEEGLKPGPVVREHILDKDGSQGGANDYTWTCQQQHLQV